MIGFRRTPACRPQMARKRHADESVAAVTGITVSRSLGAVRKPKDGAGQSAEHARKVSRALQRRSGSMVKVQQSANDSRLYRHITLPNGLQSLLISDPEIRLASLEDEGEEQEASAGSVGTADSSDEVNNDSRKD